MTDRSEPYGLVPRDLGLDLSEHPGMPEKPTYTPFRVRASEGVSDEGRVFVEDANEMLRGFDAMYQYQQRYDDGKIVAAISSEASIRANQPAVNGFIQDTQHLLDVFDGIRLMSRLYNASDILSSQTYEILVNSATDNLKKHGYAPEDDQLSGMLALPFDIKKKEAMRDYLLRFARRYLSDTIAKMSLANDSKEGYQTVTYSEENLFILRRKFSDKTHNLTKSVHGFGFNILTLERMLREGQGFTDVSEEVKKGARELENVLDTNVRSLQNLHEDEQFRTHELIAKVSEQLGGRLKDARIEYKVEPRILKQLTVEELNALQSVLPYDTLNSLLLNIESNTKDAYHIRDTQPQYKQRANTPRFLHVIFSLNKQGDKLIITFIDNATGFKPGSKILRKGFQFGLSESEGVGLIGGTGIGMAGTRALLESKGGNLYARNVTIPVSATKERKVIGAKIIAELPLRRIVDPDSKDF